MISAGVCLVTARCSGAPRGGKCRRSSKSSRSPKTSSSESSPGLPLRAAIVSFWAVSGFCASRRASRRRAAAASSCTTPAEGRRSAATAALASASNALLLATAACSNKARVAAAIAAGSPPSSFTSPRMLSSEAARMSSARAWLRRARASSSLSAGLVMASIRRERPSRRGAGSERRFEANAILVRPVTSRSSSPSIPFHTAFHHYLRDRVIGEQSDYRLLLARGLLVVGEDLLRARPAIRRVEGKATILTEQGNGLQLGMPAAFFASSEAMLCIVSARNRTASTSAGQFRDPVERALDSR